MNTVTYKIPCGILETESQTVKLGQDKKGLGAILTGYCRSHVKADVRTRFDTKNARRKDGLHSAVYL